MRAPDPLPRARDDACPGVLRLADAADGGLARVRLPGGFLSRTGIAALAEAAVELGDGRLELTSRGNIQVRGLAAGAGRELGERLGEAGLWPSATHERVRNIVASPLAGLDREPDLTELVHALDAALCAAPRLAHLSGRFLFAIDDGRGDVADLGADVLLRAGRADGPLRSGQANGPLRAEANGLRAGDPVAAALAIAEAFLDEREAQRSTAWRIADLHDGQIRVRQRAAARLGVNAGPVEPVGAVGAGPPAAGPVEQIGGGHALVLAVPLGRLGAEQARWLAGVVGPRPARVTPWRSLVLPDVAPALAQAAAALGFGADPDSPWQHVSACAGRPGCAKALADVQADARAELGRWPGRAVHWSGCERRCGRPARTEIDLIATGTGYRIEGTDA
jgi:precorrin-3B synthase